MAYIPLLPMPDVPDKLIEALNTRFRMLAGVGNASTSALGSISGLFFAHANRPDANAQTVGMYGTETDRGIVYQVQTVKSQQVWVYVAGVMRANFASRPTDLGSNDTGFLWSVTDYAHLLRWTGTGWEFADEQGNYIVARGAAPDGNGWQLCDGSATHYLHVAAGAVSEVSYTTPNLTGATSYYLRFAGTAAAPAAATAPTTTKVPQGTGSVTAVTTINADAQMAHVDFLPYYRR